MSFSDIYDNFKNFSKYKSDVHFVLEKGKLRVSKKRKTVEIEEVAQHIFKNVIALWDQIEHDKLSTEEVKILLHECLPNGFFSSFFESVEQIKGPTQKPKEVAYLFSFYQEIQKTLAEEGTVYEEILPELAFTASRAKHAITLSRDTTKRENISFLPQPTPSQTANGTYFIYIPKAPFSSETKKFERECGFVGKPSAQEGGCRGNPQGFQTTLREGVVPGQGVVREWLAYEIQKIIGVDFGVPPTGIFKSEHFYFSEEFGLLNAHLQNLITALELQDALDLKKFIAEHPEIQTPQHFLEVFRDHLLNFLSGEKKEKLSSLFILIETKKDTVKKVNILSILKSLPELQTSLLPIFANLGPLWSKKVTPGVLSVQKFEAECKTYGSLSDDKLKQIPNEEMHKLILDLIIINCDRHLNNILFKQSKEHYHLVLIDNGLSLPVPGEKAEGLKFNARYEWINFPQFHEPICKKFASILLKLNIEDFIISLKKAHKPFTNQYGNPCKLNEECFKIIRLNLHLLQVGIRTNVPITSIAHFQMPTKEEEIHYGGEIAEIYQTYLFGNQDPDWKLIEDKISAILQTPLKQRKCPYG